MYDKAPFISAGKPEECLAGWSAITSTLREAPGPICIECYPGVFLDELQQALAEHMPDWQVILASDALLPESTLEARFAEILTEDPVFMKAAEPFWTAPASAPAFERLESSLLIAFEGWPKLTPPDAKAKRIFQLRTYESPSPAAHVRKVEMFHHGEFEIFAKSGCTSVFYGDTLIGSRMPNLTYMLTFPDMAALTAGWDAFRTNPDWRKLSADPRYAYEPIVSNITNLILSPASYSQI